MGADSNGETRDGGSPEGRRPRGRRRNARPAPANLRGVLGGRPFTAHQLAAAEALGTALASSTRVQIIQILAEGERTSGAIAAVLGTSPSHVSNHLALLLDSHFVSRRREGKFRHYRLSDHTMVVASADGTVRISISGEEGCSIEVTICPPKLRLTGAE